MLQTTFALGMFALVEAFDDEDLDRCVPVIDDFLPAIDERGVCRLLLGINCRNLRTLEVDFRAFLFNSAALPPDTLPRVAESGVDSNAERRGESSVPGYQLALVGTALMRSDDPETRPGPTALPGAGWNG